MATDDDAADEGPEPIKIGKKCELEWDGAFWCGDLKLASLAKVTEGEIYLEIEDEDGTRGKVIEQGLTWLVANQAAVGKAVLAAIAKAHPAVAKSLAKHVDLRSLTVHDVKKGTKPYLGFTFGCTWDEEHGLGLMMHGDRLVKIGGGDVPILVEYAEDDAKPKKTTKKPAKQPKRKTQR